jgi:iron complex transport system substrate-binding protein
MNTKRTVLFLIMLLSFSCTVFAQGSPVNSVELIKKNPGWLIKESASSFTILDDAGVRVSIKKDVKTVVAIGPVSLCAAIRALKAENKVVGVSEWISPYKTILPVMANLTDVVQVSESINYEKIYEINPDIILLMAHDFFKDIDQKLVSHIPVVRLTVNSAESLAKLGRILGRESEAREYIDWIISKTSVIEEKTAALGKNKIKEAFFYYGGDFGMSPPPPYGTYGKDNSKVNRSIKKAGGKSITWTLPGEWITVDPEWIIEKNPATIIREFFALDDDPAMGYDTNDNVKVKKMMEQIVSSPAFATSDAVKNKDVHICSGLFIQAYWFIGLNYYAKWLHPELFKDIDPEAVHQEFLTKFLRLDYDLKHRGVFSYSAR